MSQAHIKKRSKSASTLNLKPLITYTARFTNFIEQKRVSSAKNQLVSLETNLKSKKSSDTHLMMDSHIPMPLHIQVDLNQLNRTLNMTSK
jgi:hypothetical protein